MKAYSSKAAQASVSTNKQRNGGFAFKDNRPEAAAQRKIREAMDSRSLQQAPLIQKKETKTGQPANTGIVQRFAIVDPADYKKGGDKQDELFPSNKLDKSQTSTQDPSGKSVVKKLNWETKYANNPPLKVSENGLLALESTVDQPRVFYGSSDQLELFSKRLTNIRSRITLGYSSSDSLTVPKDPENPQGATNKVIKAFPVPNPNTSQPHDELMNVNACNSVSSAIVGDRILSVGNEVDGEKLVDKVSNNTGLSTTINSLDQNSTLDDFSVERKKNNKNSPVWNPPNFIKPEVTEYFENTDFRRKHLVPTAAILKALSLDGVPEKIWEQVYKLHVVKSEDERPSETQLLSHIDSYFKLEDTFKYNRQKRDPAITSKFGINELANPEVGESFSSFSAFSPRVTDKSHVLKHELNLDHFKGDVSKELRKKFLTLRDSAFELGEFANKEFKKAKGAVNFGDHHAAVVAKDGPDSVTFENYNRGVEAQTLQEELWDTWFGEVSEFRGEISVTLHDMFKEVIQVQTRKDFDSWLHKFNIVVSKKTENIEQFQAGFIQLTRQTKAKLDSNLRMRDNDLWHFNMYGPANTTFINEKGKEKPQSFHETWSEFVPNAMTFRTTALVNDDIIRDVRKKAGIVAFQILKAGNFGDERSAYEEVRSLILSEFDTQGKRIDASNFMLKLEKLELKFPDLSPQEEAEAESIFEENMDEILKSGIKLRHKSRMESQKAKFNYDLAIKFLAPNYDIGIKYFRWYQESKAESERLQQKADFFLRFYKGKG